ncbi:MAG TPA: hypothetical protein PK765_04730 [bacterium]|nr:hypothetical protein [bacterium]
MHNTADSVASFLACREAIGRILDPLSWLEHVFRASYSETTMTSAFFHWSSYVRAHPGHPALAVSYQEIPDEEFREMSRAEQERSVLFLDDRGIPRGASGFDESAAVPCEVSEFRIVTPSLRGPDDTVVIGNGAVLYDLDVGMVDQRDDALFRRKKHDLLAVHFLPLSSRFLDGSGRWPIIRDM